MSDAWPKPWPQVPACHGWLALDERGQWRLQGERVHHPGLLAFLNDHYAHDEAGRWFVQNGPQRVFVDLAVTPWVFRLAVDDLHTHTGRPAGALTAIHLDAEGRLICQTAVGTGVLDDRDLAEFLAGCLDPEGRAADDARIGDFLAGEAVELYWSGLPLQRLSSPDLARHFGFIPQPRD